MYVKKILLILIITVTSCSVTEQPEFKDITSVKVKETKAKEIIIEATALFFNKNSVGGKIQIKDVEVFIDNIVVANVKSESFDVPAKDEFSIPLTVAIPYDKVFNKNKNNILENVLSILTNKEISLSFKGSITYKLSAFSYDYPLDHTEKISFTK